MTQTERKLKMSRTDLLKLAEKRLAQEQVAHKKALEKWEKDTVRKGQSLLDKLVTAQGNADQILKVVYDDRRWSSKREFAEKPHDRAICSWQHKVNWLKHAQDEVISLTADEFSQFDTDRCDL